MRHPSCPLCRGAYDRLPKYRLVELVRCRACGVIFSPHIPSAEDLAEHYAGYNRDHSSDNAPSIARREELLDRFEPYRKLGRMLDVGCGVAPDPHRRGRAGVGGATGRVDAGAGR